MASKTPKHTLKRGPYQRDSRTTNWRKRKHDLQGELDLQTTQLASSSSDGSSDIDMAESDEYDEMVNEFLEAELNKSDNEPEKAQSENGDQPLYSGCELTVSMSMLLIITFATRHSLTGVALCDLLNLIELHCLSNNLCRSTLKLYRQFFQSLKNPIVFNYYCEDCYLSFGMDNRENCPNCSSSKSNRFLTIPLAKQLSSILNRPGVLESIHKKKQIQLQEEPEYLKDITEGKLYREHFNRNGYFRGTAEQDILENELHLSLQINTDGVAIFKSSKFSIWPLYATINELPPNLRFARENRLFIGLWYGYEKPNMKLFLGSLLEEIKSLYKGEIVNVNKSSINLRAIVLSTVADAPARCMMLDFVQFNGNFGCPCCYTKGETCHISEKGSSHIYPYDLTDDHINNGHADLRSDKETLTLARNVEQKFIDSKRREPEPDMGVKGISMLSFFPSLSLVRGTTVDYMHCVLLGVVKMMIGLWINQDHRQEAWSIRSSIDIINERLRCISPPHKISRIPHNIDDYGDWKASEYRTFLLFYSVPVLCDILPAVYFYHYVNLVVGIYLLLKASISSHDLVLAKNSLQKFAAGVEQLYGERYSTFNVHSLLHLTQKVEDLGPLWAHSCFFYEGLNGDLRHQFHGTQQIEQQIITAVCIQQKIPELEETLQNGPAKMFYDQLTKNRKTNYKDQQLGPFTFQLGASHAYTPDKTEYAALRECFGRVSEVRKIYRVLHKGFVIHSKEYRQVKRRNSYTVCCDTGSFQILFFVQCSTTSGFQYGALAHELVTNVNETSHCSLITPVKFGGLKVIQLQDIKELVVFIDIGLGKTFVTCFPNFWEKD